MTASTPRPDAVEKVSGAARFVTDVTVPGMLHAKLLRSPLPHARIKGIDAEAALRMPGVVAVLTGADFAGLNHHWGLFLRDRPLIAVDRVRYVGEPVAAVVAEDEYSAEEALDAILVDYEDLPYVTDAEAALAPDAPLLHERMDTLKDFYFKGQAKPVAGSNVFQNFAYETGDVDAAMAAAHRVFEDSYDFPMVFHYALEPHCVIADYDPRDGFSLWSCGQSPSAVQKVIGAIFGVPQGKIRVRVPYVGGGFGGKASVKLDPLVAGLAWKLHKPVRLCLSVAESMLTCRRLSATVSLRTAVAADGTLLAMGMRGNIWTTKDLGATWTQVPTEVEQSISGGTVAKDGTITLVGLAGLVLTSKDGGKSFTAQLRKDRDALSAVAEGANGQLLSFGEKGVTPLRAEDLEAKS